MAETHWDTRTRRKADPDIAEVQKQIDDDFDFEAVLAAVFTLIEKKTPLRQCGLSVIGRDLKKRPLVRRRALPKGDKSRVCPLLSFPIPLTNDEIRYTLDIFDFEKPQLNRPESDLLEKCLNLLYQAVNKDYHERDHLTGLYNRQGFLPRITRILDGAAREGTAAAVLLLDLDHFKGVNDTYGHPVGDRVLSEFAGVIADVVAGDGVVGRWGGEEFVVVLAGADEEEAMSAAEEIRRQTEKLRVKVDQAAGGYVPRTTCSVGISLCPGHGSDAETLIQLADRALYEAKEAGRNQVKRYPLDAPQVLLKKLKERVEEGGLAPSRELESRCNIISLKERGLVRGLPLAVAVVGARLFILDGQGKKFHVYDGRAKEFVAEGGAGGEGLPGLEGPVDLAVSADGLVFVADPPTQVVKIYKAEGAFVGFIGGRDEEGAPILGYVKGSFNEPVAVALDGQGRVVVAERMNRRVQRFTPAGDFDGLEVPLEAADAAPPYQPEPRDVAADSAGNIFVVDAANDVIQKFDARGDFQMSVGGRNAAGDAGCFKGLTALAVDRRGKLAGKLSQAGAAVAGDNLELVVTAETGDFDRLQFFDAEGGCVGVVDFRKLSAPLGRLVRPGRLAVSAGGSIYVVDQENADVLQLSFGAPGG